MLIPVGSTVFCTVVTFLHRRWSSSYVIILRSDFLEHPKWIDGKCFCREVGIKKFLQGKTIVDLRTRVEFFSFFFSHKRQFDNNQGSEIADHAQWNGINWFRAVEITGTDSLVCGLCRQIFDIALIWTWKLNEFQHSYQQNPRTNFWSCVLTCY